MKVKLTSEAVNPELPGVLLISHGELAFGLLDAARMICGEQENVAALCLDENEDLNAYRERMNELTERFPAGVFILVDILCGTPFNTLASISEGKKLRGIAGANLPLLLEVLTSRSFLSVEELDNMAEDTVHGSIYSLSKFQESL